VRPRLRTHPVSNLATSKATEPIPGANGDYMRRQILDGEGSPQLLLRDYDQCGLPVSLSQSRRPSADRSGREDAEGYSREAGVHAPVKLARTSAG